jgi:hypothetical protein
VPLTLYKCYLLDAFDRIRHVEGIECCDDELARQRAAALLSAHPALRSFKLWDGERQISTM